MYKENLTFRDQEWTVRGWEEIHQIFADSSSIWIQLKYDESPITIKKRRT